MADLGKSQTRQVGNLGNSPAGATGLPQSSRGEGYRTMAAIPSAINYTSRNRVVNSTISPAGLTPPNPANAGQNYVKLASISDPSNHITKNTAFASPGITPAGIGTFETTKAGHYYASLGSKIDANAGRSGHSNALFGGKSGSTGMTQGDTGALPIPVGGGGPSVTTYFLMRARDPDCVSQPTYVYWKVTGTPDSTGSQYTGSRCGVHPLVEIVVQQTWKMLSSSEALPL